MTNLLNKFSEAAKVVSSSKTHMWECVYGAYVDHLSDICQGRSKNVLNSAV